MIPQRRGARVWAAALAASLATAPLIARAAPTAKARPEAEAYLRELDKAGLVDKGLGSQKLLEQEVRQADVELTAGELDRAAARLYSIVEGVRYSDFSDSEAFQDAEYRLGLTLGRAGAVQTSRKYFLRSLTRGKDGAFYFASLRAYIDLCLRESIGGVCNDELTALKAEDQGGELMYLRGRVAYDAGKLALADEELALVTPQSRFYTAALYLRGVAAVRRRDFGAGKRAFCVIADVKEGDRLRFVIDGRYFQLRDLARLALGRIAHEEGKHDDAFYHYFLVPQDSAELGTALFEAAFAAFEGKDHAIGAQLAEEFLRLYPDSPSAFEARLLLATLKVRTCRFVEADKELDQFLAGLQPLKKLVDNALSDPALRRSLALRLLGRDSMVPPSDEEKQLVLLLSRVQAFGRFARLAHRSDEASSRAALDQQGWNALWQKLHEKDVQAVQKTNVKDALSLSEDLEELSRGIAGLRRRVAQGGAKSADLLSTLSNLEKRRVSLAKKLAELLPSSIAPSDNAQTLVGLVEQDRYQAEKLAQAATAFRTRVDGAAGDLVMGSLQTLQAELAGLERRATLAKIDAVVRWKRQLEKEIEDLAAGRFPASLVTRLHVEGLLADDEEYWPPEREHWADEYEDYK